MSRSRAGAIGRVVSSAAVAAAVAAVVIAGNAGAAPPAATPVAPAATSVALLPGEVDRTQVVLADDAVYATLPLGGISVYGPRESAVVRWALATTAEGTTVAAPQLVARAFRSSRVAEHGGTLAYLRATDERLVLRAPDGTLTTPEWGRSARLTGGVLDLDDAWLVATDAGLGNEGIGAPRLYHRASGASFEVSALASAPSVFDWQRVTDVHLIDGHLVWQLYADRGGPETGLVFHGVYAVALGHDGPTGGTITLQTTLDDRDPLVSWSSLRLADTAGTQVAWTATTCTTGPACTSTLRWFDAPPFTGTPSELTVDGSIRSVVGMVAVGEHGSALTWTDLADGAPLATLDPAGEVYGTSGQLVAHRRSGEDRGALLTDAGGLPVTGGGPLPPLQPFTDVGEVNRFAGEIAWLADHGVVGGYGDGTFRPLAPVHRDAMAAFLYRVAGEPDVTAPSVATFVDVPVNHPFATEIEWLATSGISTGWADGTFRPGDPVSREAMAAFLYRFAHDGADAPGCDGSRFADVPADHPFCGEIAWLAEAQISMGWSDGTFRPALSIERQAVAAFLFRLIDRGFVPEP